VCHTASLTDRGVWVVHGAWGVGAQDGQDGMDPSISTGRRYEVLNMSKSPVRSCVGSSPAQTGYTKEEEEKKTVGQWWQCGLPNRSNPCTLHPAPCTLHPAPCTPHPEYLRGGPAPRVAQQRRVDRHCTLWRLRCVRVCEGGRERERERERECVCVCVRERKREGARESVCERERATERESARARERESERETVRVCVVQARGASKRTRIHQSVMRKTNETNPGPSRDGGASMVGVDIDA